MATLVWRKEAPTSYTASIDGKPAYRVIGGQMLLDDRIHWDVWFIDRSGEKPVVVVLAEDVDVMAGKLLWPAATARSAAPRRATSRYTGDGHPDAAPLVLDAADLSALIRAYLTAETDVTRPSFHATAITTRLLARQRERRARSV